MPKSIIENFYRKYLNGQALLKKKELPKLNFSGSFLQLEKQNFDLCHKFAQGDLCGWSSDGDPYLDAQDFDENLSYESSNALVTAEDQGKVRVQFNLFPGVAFNGRSYGRNILFLFIQEDGKWVIDDIVYPNHTARSLMQSEKESLLKPPK